MIPILILAAGQSSRMRGRDKLLELVDGMPLLRHRALAALQVSRDVMITIPNADHPRSAAVQDLNVSLLPIPDAAIGMAASLRRGVLALSECNHFMVLLADLPEISSADMITMITQIDRDNLIFRGTAADGTPGHPIIFHASLRPLFATITGDSGGKDIIAAHATKRIALPDQHATRDLDTPEDWASWRKKTNR